MRPSSFIFLVFLPALLALGHDAYLFYINIVETKGFTLDLLIQEFKFSALGFLWTSYEPESYKTTVAGADPETWSLIDYILTFKTFFVGLGFGGIMTAVFGLFGIIFGIGPLKFEKGSVFHASDKDKDVSFRSGQQNKKFEYKRK